MNKIMVAIIFILPMINAPAKAGIKLTVNCQQNIDDKRVLVDGTNFPGVVRYKVLNYKPKITADGWTYGECVLDITKFNENN